MSGMGGDSPQFNVQRAFQGPKRAQRAVAIANGATIQAISLKFNTTIFPTYGCAMRAAGGFAVRSDALNPSNLTLNCILSSAALGDATLFTAALVLPVAVAAKQFFTRLDVQKVQDADAAAAVYVVSGFYSFTGLASGVPFWIPVTGIPDVDTLRVNMYVQNTSAGTVLSADFLGETYGAANVVNGTTEFLNNPVNAPVT